MIWLFQYKKLIRIFKRISKILYVYILSTYPKIQETLFLEK